MAAPLPTRDGSNRFLLRILATRGWLDRDDERANMAPHMTELNGEALLDAARHRSTPDVEEFIARLKPVPHVRSTVRKLPAARVVQTQAPCEQPGSVLDLHAGNSPAAEAAAPVTVPAVARAVVAPLATERDRIQFTASRNTHDKLRCAQDLLRHVVADGDGAAVFDRARAVGMNSVRTELHVFLNADRRRVVAARRTDVSRTPC